MIEAHIDFPEEEIGSDLLDNISYELSGFSKDIDRLLAEAVKSMKLRESYRVCIVGLPNAGKSTLLNTIAKESLAITSGTPGTTRDLIRAEIDLGGVVVEFIDTAGIRENPDNDIEKEGVQRSLSAIETSNLNLIIRDITDKNFS